VSPREARFDALARALGPRLLAHLARRVDPPADAADVLAETLIVAWRRLDDVPADERAALVWLLAVARRTAANHRRGRRRRTALVEALRDRVAAATPAPDPAALDLRRALGRLGRDDREILALVAWEGLTAAEAGAVLGLAPGAARKRLQRARERLGRELGEPAGGSARPALHSHAGPRPGEG
jgi:RNA polymerase sigma-70 factor (ECF subfamily)